MSDPGQVERLCEEYAHLPRHAANTVARRTPPWVTADDMEPAAWAGLFDAARAWDEDKAVGDFRPWAWQRIVGAIQDDLRRADHVPRRLRAQRHELGDAADRMRAEGRPVSVETLAAETGFDVERVRAAVAGSAARAVSLDALGGFGVFLVADAAGGVEDDAAALEWVWAAVERLPPVQRQVMVWTYRHGWSRDECAAELGVTASRVSQVHSVAVAAVRDVVTWRLGRAVPAPAGRTMERRRDEFRRAVAQDVAELRARAKTA